MANFQIDAVPVTTDPRDCEWQFKTIGYDGNGLPILAPHAKVRVTQSWMTNAEFDEWYSKSRQDGYTSSVTVRLPAPDDATWTNYAGCYIWSIKATRKDTNYVYGIEIVIGKVAY